jgi:hypothetical protein
LGACHLAFVEDAQPSVTQVNKKYILWNPKIQHSVRFQILTPANLKMTAFWDIAPCSLVEVDRRFRCAYCLHHQGDVRLHGAVSQKGGLFQHLVYAVGPCPLARASIRRSHSVSL